MFAEFWPLRLHAASLDCPFADNDEASGSVDLNDEVYRKPLLLPTTSAQHVGRLLLQTTGGTNNSSGGYTTQQCKGVGTNLVHRHQVI